MNANLEQHCRLEIRDLESKGLIQKSRSPWSCAAFYVNKNSEIEKRHTKTCDQLQTFKFYFKMDPISNPQQKRFVAKIALCIHIF
jgi:hypothetical protein